jgi:hypothetical protein
MTGADLLPATVLKRPIRYRNLMSVLKNPFYAGTYIYGKSEHRTAIVNGRAQKTYLRRLERDNELAWDVGSRLCFDRQYDLVDEARRRGFRDVEVIDDDLGRSASGTMARPGFDRLVAWLCAGDVGAVLCFDASRLARSARYCFTVRLAACDHTARQGGFDGSVSAKLTGPIPQIAMTAGSFWLRITPS